MGEKWNEAWRKKTHKAAGDIFELVSKYAFPGALQVQNTIIITFTTSGIYVNLRHREACPGSAEAVTPAPVF